MTLIVYNNLICLNSPIYKVENLRTFSVMKNSKKKKKIDFCSAIYGIYFCILHQGLRSPVPRQNSLGDISIGNCTGFTLQASWEKSPQHTRALEFLEGFTIKALRFLRPAMLTLICTPRLGVSCRSLFMRKSWLRHFSGVCQDLVSGDLHQDTCPQSGSVLFHSWPSPISQVPWIHKKAGLSVPFGAPWQLDDAPCLHHLASNLTLLYAVIYFDLLLLCTPVFHFCKCSKFGQIVTFGLASSF